MSCKLFEQVFLYIYIYIYKTSTNDSEYSGMTGLQRAQKSTCYTSLCLLALVTSCSSYQVQDTDDCISGSAPSYFHSLLQIYTPSRSLRSVSERRLVVPSQRCSKSLSRLINQPEHAIYSLMKRSSCCCQHRKTSCWRSGEAPMK